MRLAAILSLFLAAACGSLSSVDKGRLADFQQNAKSYYDRGKMEQALAMIDKGLAIEPENYQLSSLRAMVLLRLAKNESGTRQDKLLDQACKEFEKVQSWRAPAKHAPYQLLGYGLAMRAMAMRHENEALRLRATAKLMQTDSLDIKVQENQAIEHDGLARANNLKAKAAFETLRDRGDLVRLAHKGLMEVAIGLGDGPTAFAEGQLFLADTALAKEFALKEIREARTTEWEREKRKELDQFQDEELVARSVLANLRYDNEEYEEAARQLDVVLQLDPSRSADYYNRARCLRQLGRIEEAKADFRMFIQLSQLPDNNPRKAEALQALASQ